MVRSWNSESQKLDQERGSLQNCSLIQDHKILLHQTRNFTLFCNYWIWAITWLTVVGFISWCIDNSSVLACLALSVSSQQILPNSSISWQSVAWFSWKSLFLNSNSPHKLFFKSLSLICPSTFLMYLKSSRFKFIIDLVKCYILTLRFTISRLNLSFSFIQFLLSYSLSLFGQLSQLSVQGSFGDFFCRSTNALRLCLDLFSLLTLS